MTDYSNQEGKNIEDSIILEAEESEDIEDALSLGSDAEELLQYVVEMLQLSKKELGKRLHTRLWTFSSRIRQPNKNDGSCNTTPFFYRWDTNEQTSHLTISDPRYASRKECKYVYMTLLALLLEVDGVIFTPPRALALFERILDRPFQAQSLKCVHTGQAISIDDIKQALEYSIQRLGAYEIPTSYRQQLNEGGRHVHTNVGWMKPIHINYTLREALRKHLVDYKVPKTAAKNALDKIQVKSYCTDKVTMPPHYSNRDIRWATWPHGIQYASHYDCAMVEMELMAELYEFVGAPKLDNQVASSVEVIRRRPIIPESRRCFVTGRYLEFDDYVQAAINPKGGRSKYHVGHIVPLTRAGRHAWNNIAWMSDDGNRIQGNDTVEEIEAKLVDIVEYHLKRDMEMDNPPQSLLIRVERLWTLLSDIRERLDDTRSKS